HVCDGTTGKVLSELPMEGFNGVASLVWLTDDMFVYVSKAGNVHRISRAEDNRWHIVNSERIRAGSDHLTAIASDVICWQKADCIWSLSFSSGRVNALYSAAPDRLEGFSYSSASDQFLVNTAGKNGNTLSR